MTARPNLFSYATSELSQDAFLCWLLSWADPQLENEDASLAETAQQFVEALLSKTSIELQAEVTKLEVKKQFQAIDIVVLINDDVALIIEDKVHTENHSDQLRRYRKLVEADTHHTALNHALLSSEKVKIFDYRYLSIC